MEQKAWWKSKTMWLSIFQIIYGLLPFFGIDVDGQYVILGSGVLFGILRTVTGVSIGLVDLKKDGSNT